jgi:phage-related baseplate assembly protein
MAAPTFIDNDLAAITADINALYESSAGVTLQPAQAEQTILNIFAYRESLLRSKVQSLWQQNLVDYAIGINLDNLGALMGVVRLDSNFATCTMRFNIITGHSGVTIPVGTRIGSTDGQKIFRTVTATTIPVGTYVADVQAQSTVEGTSSNGFIIGSLSNLLDPLAFVTSVSNTNVTAGGSDIESDDTLRTRIRLAPNAFSNAGSYGAYRFFALSANPDIIDVAITSPIPGQVNIYPLLSDGSTTPQQVLDQVYATCNAETVRPLTDTVVVEAPTIVDYDLVLDLTIYNTAIGSDVQAAVLAALQSFVDLRRQSLGQDLTDSQIIRQAQIDGVYKVELVGWSDLTINDTEYPFCNSITVNIIASVNG